MPDGLFMIKFNLGVFLILFGIALLLIGLAMLYVIWKQPNLALIQEARRLSDLIKRARRGDLHAQEQCKKEPDIKKKLVYKNGAYETHYEVPWVVVRKAFNIDP